MDMKKCSSCGKEIPQESKFCPYCMERINEPTVVSVPEDKKSNKKIVAIIILLFIIVLTIIAIFVHGKISKSDEYVDNGISTEETSGFNGVDSSNDDTTSLNEIVNPNFDGNNINRPSQENVGSTEDVKTTNSGSDSTSTTGVVINTTTTQCIHNWITQTKIVHHDEVGHYETVQKQRQITQYKCPVCYKKIAGLSEYYSHFDNTHKPSYSGDPVSMLRNQYTTETGYEYYNVQEWVVDREAYDETVVTGYKCKICGIEKSS